MSFNDIPSLAENQGVVKWLMIDGQHVDRQQVHKKSVESWNSIFNFSLEKHTSNQKIYNISVHPSLKIT